MDKVWFAIIAMGCACAAPGSEPDPLDKRRVDAAVEPPAPDAPPAGAAGWVTCYTSGNPAVACDLSTSYCCFDNFWVPNNGECIARTSTCVKSPLACDSDADCAAGEQCWGESFRDASDALRLDGRCTATPTSWHLCQPGDGTCAAGQDCVQAEGSRAQLYGYAPTVYVCDPF